MKKLFSLLALAIIAIGAHAVELDQITGTVWQSDPIIEEVPELNAEGQTSLVLAFTDNGKCAVCFSMVFKIKLGPETFAQATGLMQGKGTYTLKNNKITISIDENGYTFLIPPETVVAENVPDETLAEQMKEGCLQILAAVSEQAPKEYKFMTLKNVNIDEQGIMTFKFDGDNHTLHPIK